MKALWFAPALALALSAPASAEPAERSTPIAASVSASSTTLSDAFGVFVPRPTKRTKFDYSIWDEALDKTVFDLGPSLRERARAPRRATDTRLTRGHDSPFRLEGTRFTFAYINDSYEEGLREYRQELEALGSRYDIASLPKNEQLAYWTNLHNVALIEKVSEAYPVSTPSRIKVKVGDEKVALDDAKFITVKGVPLSLKDIRTRIVYPNWNDPDVIYGFFRGDIGGPRLSPVAFSGDNIAYQLDRNADEFINSLRGFSSGRRVRYVSDIYREAQPYYFPVLETDLIAHMESHIREEVRDDLMKPNPVKFATYEADVADLSKGGGRGTSAYGNARMSPEVMELLRESETKYFELIRRGLVRRPGTATGTVIIEDIETEDLSPDPKYAPYVEGFPADDDE